MIAFIGPRALHVQIPVYGDLVTGEEGFEYRPVTGWVPGWHANIPAPCPPGLQSYAVTPANPVNIYAEDQPGTVFLKFADEGEGMAALEVAGLIPEE